MSLQPLTKPDIPEKPQAELDGRSSHAERSSNDAVASKQSIDFDELYERWFEEVARWIRAMGGPEADRDDLVQEVFIVVHRRLKDFDGTNLAGWIYQIARRKVRDFRRLRWAKRLVFLEREPNLEAEYAHVDPSVSLETREKRDMLMRLLGGLNECERAAIVLFEIEGYSGQHIAEIQSVPLNTVWTRIHKARQKLKLGLEAVERGAGKRVGP